MRRGHLELELAVNFAQQSPEISLQYEGKWQAKLKSLALEDPNEEKDDDEIEAES